LAVRIEYKASVEKDLRKLSPTAAARLLQRLERALASEGKAGESLSGEFVGLYRLRVGDYRIIYVRTDEGYLVLRIGQRREVYRKARPAAG
jgi:mRNA interferase RelE/StbE